MYSVEGLSDRDGLWSDYTESWGQWNSGSAVNESVGSHYQFSTQVLGIEAELPSRWSIGTTANSPEWVIQTEINASGQQFLTSDTNSGWVMATPTSSGGATYSIANLSNGTYYLWVRMSDLNGNGSGVVFELDGTPIHSTGKVLSTMNNSWEWVNSAWDGAQSTHLEFTITEPGRHNLTMRMADDGISVDELLVTSSWSFTQFGDQLNSPLISDLTLREAWVNFSLPESNVWRTFSANVTDTANRVNSTSIMVQHDNIGPSLVVNGYKFLNNISQPDLTLVTEPGVQIWLNGSELIVSENGTVDLNITLHPTWWSVRDGDPTDVTTWNWTALNEFEIVALDQAGNWNEMQFGMVYDSWGAQNINPQYPQLLVDYYRGINSDGEWILPAFTSPDALNAINGPLTFNLSVFFDTKNVCVNLLNETGIIGATGCNEFSTPPWGDEELSVEIDAPLYMGGQSEYLLDISVVLDHTNLSDGDWELQIVSEDWAGNWGTHSQMLSLDRSAPVISINTPSHNQTLDNHHLSLEWDVSEPAEQSLVFDGLLIEEFVAGPSSFSAEIILDSSGWHQICLLALDITLGPDKNLGTECIDVYLDPDAYEPSVSASWNHQIINTPKILMDLHIGDEQGWALKQWEAQGWNIQNGSELSSGNFSVWVNLNEGLNQFELEMEALDRMFVFELDVTLDTRPPLLTIDSPPDGHSTALGAIVVEGECESNLSLIVELSDIYSSTLSCAGDGTYSYKLEFPEYEGEMVLTVSSTDDAGNTATTAVELKSDKQAPRATLSWVESDCHTQPVPTISSMDPIPICDLSVRADFLDPDITFWSLSFEHERSFVTSVMGGIPEDSSILLGVGKDAAPGLWSAELIIEDAAGNRQVVNLEANLVATESTLAAKVATPLSIQNIIAIFGLLIGLGVFINRRGRRKAMNDWQEIL
nr:hypothetical protein [Euryarchaeota archaeon]